MFAYAHDVVYQNRDEKNRDGHDECVQVGPLQGGKVFVSFGDVVDGGACGFVPCYANHVAECGEHKYEDDFFGGVRYEIGVRKVARKNDTHGIGNAFYNKTRDNKDVTEKAHYID